VISSSVLSVSCFEMVPISIWLCVAYGSIST
jgi:hypothetical protein